MIPGPIHIIQCPQCGHPGKKSTLMSGNTFGAEFWSDGKQVAPMLPEYPYLVKCIKCGTFFFAEEENAIGQYEWPERVEDKWPEAKFFEFPSFHEYFEALGTDIDELYIRYAAFKSYNDYIRENKEDEITQEMKDLNNDNMKSLLCLFSEKEPGELFPLIEINRQLGRFDKCQDLLGKVDETTAGDIKKKFEQEIENRSTRLFRLY